MMEGKLLLPEDILNRWAELSPLMSDFLNKGQGESTVFDIAQKCINLQYQCWVVDSDGELVCVCVTRIDEYPTFNSLHILGIAGVGLKEWKHFHPTLENFAKINDCTRITQWGRQGWARMLKGLTGVNNEEYKVIHTVMAMELTT